MIETNNYYWYGVAAAVYIVTCMMFSAVRAFHNSERAQRLYLARP